MRTKQKWSAKRRRAAAERMRAMNAARAARNAGLVKTNKSHNGPTVVNDNDNSHNSDSCLEALLQHRTELRSQIDQLNIVIEEKLIQLGLRWVKGSDNSSTDSSQAKNALGQTVAEVS